MRIVVIVTIYALSLLGSPNRECPAQTPGLQVGEADRVHAAHQDEEAPETLGEATAAYEAAMRDARSDLLAALDAYYEENSKKPSATTETVRALDEELRTFREEFEVNPRILPTNRGLKTATAAYRKKVIAAERDYEAALKKALREAKQKEPKEGALDIEAQIQDFEKWRLGATDRSGGWLEVGSVWRGVRDYSKPKGKVDTSFTLEVTSRAKGHFAGIVTGNKGVCEVEGTISGGSISWTPTKVIDKGSAQDHRGTIRDGIIDVKFEGWGHVRNVTGNARLFLTREKSQAR